MTSALQPATEIPLQIGPHTVMLRASLRAAVALEALPGGIASVYDALARQKLTAIHAVIRAAATDRQAAEIALAYASRVPLVSFHGFAQAGCLALLASVLAPAQGEATTSPAPASDPMPLSRFFTELFSLATSWLGWPPSEVWNASVAEITTALEAQAERQLRLAGIPTDKPAPAENYTAERLRQIEEQDFDPAFDREAFRAFKARHQ